MEIEHSSAFSDCSAGNGNPIAGVRLTSPGIDSIE
jgi:hypothetical protein